MNPTVKIECHGCRKRLAWGAVGDAWQLSEEPDELCLCPRCVRVKERRERNETITEYV